MLCKQCGFDLSSQANFCPSCGKKVADEERQNISSPKHSAKWLKILSGILLSFLILIVLIILLSEDITDIVAEQLKSIKENKLTEAYYDYTSKPFQESTSLESFRSLMKTYPAFARHQSVRFIDRSMENERGTLRAMILTDEGVEIPVMYTLIKEGDQWKITAIQFQDHDHATKTEISKKDEIFDSKPLQVVIRGMMEQIRQKNLMKAYESYTSKEFQKTTTIKEFDAFIKENASFSQNSSVELKDLSFDNNVATMTGILKSHDGTMYPAEYDLIQENGEWKIFHVQVSNPNQKIQTDSPVLHFSRFVLGSNLGNDGLVVSPKTLFKTDSGDIYLNLYADNVKTDAKIQVIFEHIDTHSTLEPISSKVLGGQDAVLTFIFSPPANGWPTGKYRLSASASTGENGVFEFSVEK